MYLVDSSTLISLFRPEELAHLETQELIRAIPDFFISDYVLSEVLTVLRLKENEATVKRAAERLELNAAVRRLRLGHAEFEKTIDFFLSQKKISFVDASLVVMAHERGLALITQDKQLLKIFKNYKGPGKAL